MNNAALLAGALAFGLFGTGCATKKYVAKSIAPIDQRVTSTESKNQEQDKAIESQTGEIQDLDRDLATTKEKLNDTGNRAGQAIEAAKAADQKAGEAHQAADSARSLAEQGLDRLGRTIDSMNKFQMAKSKIVLFKFNDYHLSPDSKQALDDLTKQATGLDRYVIEVQGFTDKTGNAAYNDMLSQRRAESVARYLTNQCRIPLRDITVLGEGYAQPVADDKTRDGRKENRRVEVKLWVQEGATSQTQATASRQQ